jgi:Ca2+-binding EF-hand superfamily protein
MSFIPDAVVKKAIDFIYMKYDRDRSNTLDTNELVGCFNELLGMVGIPTMANSFVMKMILKKMDKDGDGKISKPEFLNIFRLF